MQNSGQTAAHFRRLSAYIVIFCLTAWLVVTACAWGFLTYHRKISGIKYVDLLLPSRWQNYRQSRGNFYLTQGETFLQSGEPLVAAQFLRNGLALTPDNLRGRLLLAAIYQASRRLDLATDVLTTGLSYSQSNPAYLTATFQLLDQTQQDELALSLAQRCLASAPPPSRSAQIQLAFSAANAACARSQYGLARELLIRYQLDLSPEGTCLMAQMEWAEGLRDLATMRLMQYQADGRFHLQVNRLLNQYLHAAGRLSEWHTNTVAGLLQYPDDPGLRVESLRFHHESGNAQALEKEFGDCLQQHAHDPSALLLVADFCASIGRPDFAGRIAQTAHKAGPDQQAALAILLAESLLNARQYQQALDHLSGQLSPPAHLVASQTSVRALALFSLGQLDEARLQIEHLLRLENTRPDLLVSTASRLRELGPPALAQPLLARALELAPQHRSALAALVDLALDHDALLNHTEHLHALLRSRQPPRELLARVSTHLGSDRHLLHPAQRPLLALLQSQPAHARPLIGSQ